MASGLVSVRILGFCSLLLGRGLVGLLGDLFGGLGCLRVGDAGVLGLDGLRRGLVGLDPALVDEAFVSFVQKHPAMSAQQLHFLQVLQNYIAQNGGIEIERLYKPPFTMLHAESVDGVFTLPGQVEDLVAGIECPVRAIFADPAQPYLPDELRRRRVALLPQGELIVIPGGHHLHMQAPGAVAEAIGGFFQA